jgi:hypothetical protein
MKKFLAAAAMVGLLTTTAHAGNVVKREKNIGEIIWINGQGGEWRPWKSIVQDFIVLAAKHGANKAHACFPEEKRCVDALTIKIRNDHQWKQFGIATYHDAEGQAVENTICWFNENGDVRQCLTYGQQGEGAIEMQGSDGWQMIQSSEQPESKGKDNGGI